MNIQLKKIRKTLRPFQQLIKERDYLALGRMLEEYGIAAQDYVKEYFFNLTCADAYKLTAPYRRPRNVVLAGHSLLSAIEIALRRRGNHERL